MSTTSAPSMREVAELLADAAIEVRSRELRQAADPLPEPHLELVSARQFADRSPGQDHRYRIPAGAVADGQDVVGRNNQSPGGERVRGDEADHVPLDAPGQDRTLVGEVVAGGPGGGGGDQAVTANVADFLPPEAIGKLGNPAVRLAKERDVVSRDRHLGGELRRHPRQGYHAG